MALKDYTTRSWSQLCQLKSYIEQNSKTEKIIKFNGYELITNIATYGLYDGVLSVSENVVETPKKKIAKRKAAVKKKAR